MTRSKRAFSLYQASAVACVRYGTTFLSRQMSNNESQTRAQEEDERPKHAELVEHAIRGALTQLGVAPAAQANTLAETFNITASQARRKLRYGIWTIHELLVLQDRFNVSFMSVLQHAGGNPAPGLESATLLINGQQIDCEVRPGPVMTPSGPPANLACSRAKGRWWISTLSALEAEAPGQLRYAVEQLQVVDGGSPLRIAVLDDDSSAAESLATWFSESGYPSAAFATSAALEQAGIGNFDAFILDVVLKSGTCYDLIDKIRDTDANAVIMLLTGKSRGNAPLEHEIAEVVRDHHVEFAVKPTSPALLLASILSSVARRRP